MIDVVELKQMLQRNPELLNWPHCIIIIIIIII
jgi:hypothetical protein